MVDVKALEVIQSALRDSWVRMGRRYSLLQRARKICQSSASKKSSQKRDLWLDFADDCMNDVGEPRSVSTVAPFLKSILFIVI